MSLAASALSLFFLSLFTKVRGIRILGSSHVRSSTKFALGLFGWHHWQC